MFRIVLPPDEYAALKKYVLQRDGFKCRVCRFRCNLHVHHVRYRSQGGDDADYNLVTVCNECHELLHKNKITVIGYNADVPGGMKFLRGEFHAG